MPGGARVKAHSRDSQESHVLEVMSIAGLECQGLRSERLLRTGGRPWSTSWPIVRTWAFIVEQVGNH